MLATIGDVSLDYELTGEGPELVWLHGLSGSVDEARMLVEELSRSYRVLSYSTRGHGRSTPVLERHRYTYDVIARDLEAMLDHVGFDRPVLAGGSHGANTILRHETLFPGRARGLVLVAPGANALRRPKRPQWWLLQAVLGYQAMRHGDAGIVKAICGYDPRLTHDDPDVQQWVAAAQSHDMASLRAAMRFIADQQVVRPSDLPGFSVPTVVGAWPKDPVIHPIAVAQEIARLIPGAVFEPMPRPHGLPPREFARIGAELIGRWAAIVG